MSVFDLDCECDYSEYKKTIYYHANNFVVPKDHSQSSHLNTCQLLHNKAQGDLKTKEFALAFFYFLRCIRIIEETKLRDTAPQAKKILRSCLDNVDHLERNELVEHFNTMIEKLRSSTEERKRIISQQHLPDGCDADSTDNKLALHQKRQQELLLNENTRLEDVLHKLKETSIPSPKPVAPENTNGDRKNLLYWRDTTPTKDLPIAPARRIDHPLPHSYKEWNFGKGTSTRSSANRRGMVNLGNTCYLNSVTQVLSTTLLGVYFLNNDYIGSIVESSPGQGRLVNSFCYVIRELYRDDSTLPVSPSPFKKAIGEMYEPFLGSSQQDANEFLRVLLDGMHSNLNERGSIKNTQKEIDTTKGTDAEVANEYMSQYTEGNKSIIVETCIFQERSSLQCPLCNQISRSFSPSMGVEVPIPTSGGPLCIEDCLRAYSKEEILDADSLYSCPSCRRKVHATKQLLFYSLPKLLFITLKRFRSYGDFSNKVSDPVFFQMELDMSPYTCSGPQNAIYKLVGIVNHQGNTYGGHYTADSIGADGNWFSCSDERINEATSPNFRLAYILCYVRKE